MARDNESGLFSGNVEVYLNASFYNDADTYNTLVTNENSTKLDPFEINNIHYDFHRGKQLAELPKSKVSSTTHTGTVIGVSDGYTPNSGDWVIVDEGFCDASGGGGYSHVYITTFERDPYPIIPIDFGFIYANSEMAQSGAYEDRQSLYMRFQSDRWSEITLTPSSFASSSSLYIVDPGSGASYISTSQPTANTSWFKIELF